jgi:pyruvate dehydrogenase E1 component alpha subunit
MVFIVGATNKNVNFDSGFRYRHMLKDFVDLPKEKTVELYTTMLRIRKFEEAAASLFAQGLIPGLIHLYIGEEAVAVGVCSSLNQDDYIVSTHRGHGHCIAKGGNVRRMMAELLGKETGYSRGRGGSMHIIAPEIGVMGCSGIVGAGIPAAAGLGLASDVKKTKKVVVSFFGDGASNTGIFHEGLNLAAVWKLPVVFVCENNLYAISVPMRKSTLIKDVADRGVAYGIPSVIVDGMDVIAVHKAAREAVERARTGGGPTLMECKTYRFRGHFEGDPKGGGIYRTELEMTEWQNKCPVKTFRAKLIENGVLTTSEIEERERKVAKEIEEAIEFAKSSPFPRPEEVANNVFASGSKEGLEK